MTLSEWQLPWLAIANKQLELMARYMSELGLTPSARTRIAVRDGRAANDADNPVKIVFVTQYEDGTREEHPHHDPTQKTEERNRREPRTIEIKDSGI